MAMKKVFESGLPISTSVMFACPWYQEAVEILKVPDESRSPEQNARVRLAQKIRGNTKRAYMIKALAEAIEKTIEGDRITKGYTDIKPDREDDRLDAFYASWDEARTKMGIVDSPIGG